MMQLLCLAFVIYTVTVCAHRDGARYGPHHMHDDNKMPYGGGQHGGHMGNGDLRGHGPWADTHKGHRGMGGRVERGSNPEVDSSSSRGDGHDSGTSESLCSQGCPYRYDPVCGSDGTTYSNECVLKETACTQAKEILVQKQGTCDN